ncbi:uncharacterized protein N7473_004221 [Penicillium subrubescens]|uniref:uncharacterized protein n=1 Tax=Penicillium subrubescens TaxID=1316194 RepID=UPI00254574D6|nr:uncharacterized protein N7473_004221 [Penicillium subrubescens]KAJ5907305.1 hypothetical protein N7473_004221 [Penicillium subrubescens]
MAGFDEWWLQEGLSSTIGSWGPFTPQCVHQSHPLGSSTHASRRLCVSAGVTVFAIISTKNHVAIQILLCVLLKSLQPRVLYRAFDEAQAVETTWVLNIHSSLSYWGEFSLSSWGAQEKLFVLYNLTMVYECGMDDGCAAASNIRSKEAKTPTVFTARAFGIP